MNAKTPKHLEVGLEAGAPRRVRSGDGERDLHAAEGTPRSRPLHPVRWLPGLVGLLLGALLTAPAAAQQETDGAAGEPIELRNTWYAQALATSPIGLNVTHFWSKEDKLRAETVIAGRRVITIVNQDVYFAYDLVGRNGLAIGRAPVAMKQDASRVRPFGNELAAVLRQGAEKIGEEELGGRAVEIYRVTDLDGRRQIWVTKDEMRLPLRIAVFRRSTAQNLSTDFLNWQRGLSISDEFFVPEEGVKLVRMSYDQYVEQQALNKPIGPVPVLYADLLHGY